MLNIDIDAIKNILNNSLIFILRNKRDSFPSFITTRNLVINSFHVSKNDYFPSTKNVGFSTSEDALYFSKACFYTYDATNVQTWKDLGYYALYAYTDFFFTDLVPFNPDIWDSHWLCVAFGNQPIKGSQPITTPPTSSFNYGNFDTIVNFVNGVGNLSSALVADVYKVYDVNSKLKYKNVYSDIDNIDSEISINYWVTNYNLEGANYRVKPDRTRTPTSEAVGLIKLIKNYTGQAKVVWSDYSGASVTSPTSARTCNGLVEPEPILHSCKKDDGRIYLNTTFKTYWYGIDAFTLALVRDGNIFWKRCADAFKMTSQYALRLQNNSYFYKKENVSEAFRYPGTSAFTTNNSNNQPPNLTVSKETSALKLNYIKLQIDQPVAGSFPSLTLQNNLIQTYVDGGLSIYLEYATNIDEIIEVNLSLSPADNDTTEEYVAYVFSQGDSVAKNITLSYYDFVRWINIIWYPTINFSSVTKLSTGDALVTFSFVQDIIGSAKPVVLVANFNKNSGTGEIKLNGKNFTNNPPIFNYASTGQILIRLRDSAGNYWKTTLPDSGGQWRFYAPTWSVFFAVDGNGNTIVATPSNGIIQECAFEIASGSANMRLYYVAPDAGYYPITITIPSIAYKARIISKLNVSHTLWIGDFKSISNQNDKIPYTPGAAPFSRNTIKTPNSSGGFNRIKDSWSDGNLGIENISPYHMFILGDTESYTNQISFISDSFTAYSKQSSSRIRGIPVPSYISNLWDTDSILRFADRLTSFTSSVMGFIIPFIFDRKTTFSSSAYKFNYFSWKGNYRNSKDSDWFGNCAIAMEATARYVYINPSDFKAKSLVSQYLTFLSNDYDIRESLRPLTDIPAIFDPQSKYDNPYFAALIGKTALFANLAGVDAKLSTDIIDICYRYLLSQSVSSGSMLGAFSAAQPKFTYNGIEYQEYFSVWHSACIEFLSLLISNQKFIIYPQLSVLGILPSIQPTKISQIKAAPYSKENLVFSDGNRQSIRQRETQSGRTITIEYQMITNDDLEILVDFWKKHGTSEVFQFPSDIPVLSQWMFDLYGKPTYWRMSQPFSLETVVATSFRGRFNTSITIIQD